ncbi:MAG: hypothetical protein DLM64_12935 [Solirubrobacterales bacterium]|nr:MAG: hypothetical protein DLM64_12935 [Solirubrobacterales bacterium]
MLGRKASATVGVLVMMALLAGCGGSSSSVSPAAYAKSVCGAIGPFQQKLVSSGSLDLSKASPVQGRQLLQHFFSSVATASDQAASQLKAAGSPKIGNGKAISSAIVTAFMQLKGSLTQAASQASSLPTASVQRFRTAAAQLSSGVKSSMASIDTSFSGLKSKELDKVVTSTPACQKLGL